MYVLHHADQPELYSDLPKDPHISPMVRTWKGFAKPLALAAMAFTAVAGFFHYVGSVRTRRTMGMRRRPPSWRRNWAQGLRRPGKRHAAGEGSMSDRRHSTCDPGNGSTAIAPRHHRPVYAQGSNQPLARGHGLRARGPVRARAVSSGAVLVHQPVRRRSLGRGFCIRSSACS